MVSDCVSVISPMTQLRTRQRNLPLFRSETPMPSFCVSYVSAVSFFFLVEKRLRGHSPISDSVPSVGHLLPSGLERKGGGGVGGVAQGSTPSWLMLINFLQTLPLCQSRKNNGPEGGK